MTIIKKYNPYNPYLTDFIVGKSKRHPKHGCCVVYKLYFSDSSCYIGVTNNMRRRFHEHQLRFKDIISYRILYDSDDKNDIDEIYQIESQLVNENFLKFDHTRNKGLGGYGCKGSNRGPRPDVRIKNLENGFSKFWAGKERSYEDKKLKSDAATKTPNNSFRNKSLCPHCGKSGSLANLNRWHLDKCPTKTGKPHQRNKSHLIETPKGIFKSTKEASREFEISDVMVMYYCKSDYYPKWKVLE